MLREGLSLSNPPTFKPLKLGKMKTLLKYQSKRITVANGTAAGTITDTTITVDESYDKVTGYNAHVVSRAGATETFSLGIVDNGGIVQDRTFENDHISNTSVAMKERYKEINIVAKGNQLRISVENTILLTADLVIDVVLKLEKNQSDC